MAKAGQLVSMAGAIIDTDDLTQSKYDPNRELAHTIFVVGDVGQTLFGFSGANPDILSHELKGLIPDIETVLLKINYRSTQTIIEMARKLIEHNYSDLGGPFAQEVCLPVEARPGAPVGEPIEWNFYGTPEEEANGVAATIIEGINNGWDVSDVFVGARTRAQLAYIEAGLAQSDIPYINLCGGSFWLQRHVNLAIQYLTLAWCETQLERDGLDEQTVRDLTYTSSEAFEKVYNIATQWNTYIWGDNEGQYCPHRYLGAQFLNACRENGIPQYKKVFEAQNKRRSWKPGVEDLVGFMRDIMIAMSSLDEANEWEAISQDDSGRNVGQVIQVILDNCLIPWLRHDEGLSGNEEGSKSDDLQTVVAIASEFKDVGLFLGHVQKLVEAAEQSKNGDWSKHVIISTVHKLKGLERPVVFGIGWCEGVNPMTGDPVGLLPHTFSLRVPPNDGILPGGGKSEIWEERCVAYVLVTRAQERVFLSAPKLYRDYIMHPSRFLFEMGLLGEVEDEPQPVDDSDSTVEGDSGDTGNG